MSSEATIVVCTYHVQAGKQNRFEGLLKEHLPTLTRLGLAKDQPSITLKRSDEHHRPSYVQVFEWTSINAADRAHEVPDVIAIWEPMATLCEPRDGRPAMDFPHFKGLGFEEITE